MTRRPARWPRPLRRRHPPRLHPRLAVRRRPRPGRTERRSAPCAGLVLRVVSGIVQVVILPVGGATFAAAAIDFIGRPVVKPAAAAPIRSKRSSSSSRSRSVVPFGLAATPVITAFAPCRSARSRSPAANVLRSPPVSPGVRRISFRAFGRVRAPLRPAVPVHPVPTGPSFFGEAAARFVARPLFGRSLWRRSPRPTGLLHPPFPRTTGFGFSSFGRLLFGFRPARGGTCAAGALSGPRDRFPASSPLRSGRLNRSANRDMRASVLRTGDSRFGHDAALYGHSAPSEFRTRRC